jgi:hypothetical protein
MKQEQRLVNKTCCIDEIFYYAVPVNNTPSKQHYIQVLVKDNRV